MEKAAELLDMEVDDVKAKYEEICKQNNIDMEKEQLLARGLFRQWYASVRVAKKNNPTSGGSDSFFKNALGFFVSMDEARDMMAIQRDRVVNEYRRDSETTFNLGKVAVITSSGDGYEMRRMHLGEEVSGQIENLPDNHIEVDTGTYLVPVDYTEKYGARDNANFGKPLAKEEFRRSGVFIGEVDGNLGKFYFNYKGEHSKTFNPKTFEFVHFTCILNSNDATRIHGATDKTMLSLCYNADLAEDDEKRVDITTLNVQDEIMQRSEDNYSPLVDLERYHQTVASKTYNDRFVFTDGTVSSVNMTPTSNGNRIVNLTDLNADFDYGEEFNNGTTCWVPSHIEIDFGIGSQAIIVGRTSQGTDENGNLRPVSINVTGLYVTDRRGGPSDAAPVEDNVGWF